MSASIRVTNDLYNLAKIQAKAELRTIPSQVEYWARIGRTAIDNPDLPIDVIEKLLVALNEPNEPFELTD